MYKSSADQEYPHSKFTQIINDKGIFQGAVGDKGVYLFDNGNIYIGEYKNNDINGFGSLYFADGGIIRGTFLNSKLSHLGIGYYFNGDIYAGEWDNGLYSGKGMTYQKQFNKWELAIYERGVKTSTLNQGSGKPMEICINSTLWILEEAIKIPRYSGAIANGLRDGIGINYYNDGSYYEGMWKNDFPNGLGVFYNGDGCFNIGQFNVFVINRTDC